MKNYIIIGCFAVTSIFAQTKDAKACTGRDLPFGLNKPYVELDFIYWYARQQGNDFATTGIAITVPGTVDPNTALTPGLITNSGSLYEPSAKMNPGVKILLGNEMVHDNWKVFLEYTYLTSATNKTVESPDLNTGILPIFNYGPNNSILSTTLYAVDADADGYVASARGDWELYFNCLKLELEKDLANLEYFIFTPHFGLNAAWMYQKLDVLYKVNSITTPADLIGSNLAKFKQDFWGIGPAFGLDTKWRLNPCLSLFGDASLALLYGSFNVRAQSYDTNVDDDYTNVLIANQRFGVHTTNPVLRCALGLVGNWCVYSDHLLQVKAAWESQIWYFQNQHSTTLTDSSLVLQGLTIGARVTY